MLHPGLNKRQGATLHVDNGVLLMANPELKMTRGKFRNVKRSSLAILMVQLNYDLFWSERSLMELLFVKQRKASLKTITTVQPFGRNK